MAMASSKPLTINSLLIITTTIFAFMMIEFPAKTDALIPYNRPLIDMMMNYIPSEDPFKILEQNPINIAENINLARADWKESATHHVITLDVPGMKREDVKIEVEENRVLKVSGERKAAAAEEGDGDKWHRAERMTSGRFWRQFRLPVNADMERITAQLEDGVLKIKVPKLTDQVRNKSKVIEIVGQRSSGEDIKAAN